MSGMLWAFLVEGALRYKSPGKGKATKLYWLDLYKGERSISVLCSCSDVPLSYTCGPLIVITHKSVKGFKLKLKV